MFRSKGTQRRTALLGRCRQVPVSGQDLAILAEHR